MTDVDEGRLLANIEFMRSKISDMEQDISDLKKQVVIISNTVSNKISLGRGVFVGVTLMSGSVGAVIAGIFSIFNA